MMPLQGVGRRFESVNAHNPSVESSGSGLKVLIVSHDSARHLVVLVDLDQLPVRVLEKQGSAERLILDASLYINVSAE